MISKDMFELLSALPEQPEKIEHTELLNKVRPCLPPAKASKIIEEASTLKYLHKPWVVSNSPSYCIITEAGKVAIEQYELNQRLIEQNEQSNALAKKSFRISRIAMWAAIASAITAFLSFVTSLLPYLFDIVQKNS